MKGIFLFVTFEETPGCVFRCRQRACLQRGSICAVCGLCFNLLWLHRRACLEGNGNLPVVLATCRAGNNALEHDPFPCSGLLLVQEQINLRCCPMNMTTGQRYWHIFFAWAVGIALSVERRKVPGRVADAAMPARFLLLLSPLPSASNEKNCVLRRFGHVAKMKPTELQETAGPAPLNTRLAS